MQDNITVGKLTGCRVCDVIEDHYEYLIWANKQGMLMFTKIVTETIAEHAGYKNKQRHQEEEIEPYDKDLKDQNYLEIDFDDVPF